jgi:hypothetical protein
MASAVFTIDLSDDFIGRIADAVAARMGGTVKPGPDKPQGRAASAAGATTPGAGEPDPWDSPSAGQGASEPDGPEVVEVKAFGQVQTWTLRKPGAPKCQCGEPAALVDAKSKAGKPYQQWKCAKGAGSDWKKKCDYKEWA